MQEAFKLINGDMLQELDKLEECSIDCIITDPPYELGFMGKSWDSAGISFQKSTWEKCIRVLKPGGYLLAFGGSRTYHRIACAIEDAGFEIRDCIMWIFGSGFPKSMNVSKTIEKQRGILEPTTETLFNNPGGKRDLSKRSDYGYKYEPVDVDAKNWSGWGSCLKPAYEPIIISRKPFDESLVDNVLKNGVGGLNIDECRVPFEDTPNPATNPLYRQQNGYKHDRSKSVAENSVCAFSTSPSDTPHSPLGRFPANLILTYDETDFDEVCGGMPDTKSSSGDADYSPSNNDNVVNYTNNIKSGIHFGDSGSASRYFYCAKASKRDRDEGVPPTKQNFHPTVKPTSLMQYLIRLVAPKGATILDPFMGSGSTGKAVAYENFDRNADYKFIGIELDKDYTEIAKARIEYVIKNPIPIDTKPIVKSKTDNSKKVHKLF